MAINLTQKRSDDLMARIRTACSLMGIKQKDLADSLNLKPSQMNLYFQGKVEMRTDRLLALLNILGVDIEQQLDEKIRTIGGEKTASAGIESRMLASIGRLDDHKKQSILRIVRVLGSK